MSATVAPVEIGWRACIALARARGSARQLATLSESVYLLAAGEVVWLGRAGAALHGRAALVPSAPPDAAELNIDVSCARCWRPPAFHDLPRARIAAGCRTLRDAITTLGEPAGFGVLLAGGTPAFPLADAVDVAGALAEACATDDPPAALAAARTLIGLGPGLTPAGDDYVGAAFFARMLLGPGGTRHADGWADAAAGVRALAAERTHPISAALLADLTAGEGHAPLHDLAGALALEAPLPATLASARRLTRIGHSSGWDMLAGFIGAILGSWRGQRPPPPNLPVRAGCDDPFEAPSRMGVE